jgi:DNA helicase HerA-like ATPase
MEDEVAYNQICYLGILDTIKLKKIGYCVKLPYEVIDKRFKWLVRFHYSLEAFPKEITQSLQSFLPRYNQEDMLFGSSKVFFKDYAFTALNKKYNLFLQDLNRKCTLIQKNIIAFVFARKRKRYRIGSTTIKKYLQGMLASRKYEKIIGGIVHLQREIRLKLNILRKTKRLKNILVLQAYIKMSVCKRNKQKVFNSLQKIISLIRRYKLRKNVQKFAIVNMLKDIIVDRAWRKISLERKAVVERYIRGFLIQVGQRGQISTANYNTHKKFEAQSELTVQKYIKGFHHSIRFEHFMSKVRYLQRTFQTWLHRQRFLKLRKAAIVIQRAYR